MQLFKELQRRNVFRVSIGYIVSSWLLIQVADIVLETIAAPGWVMKTIMLVLALGFPVVAFFSWAYEVTPDGIRRESEVDHTQSITHVTSRKLDRAIVTVLVIALAYFAYDKFILDPKRVAALIDDVKQNVTEQASARPPDPTQEGIDPASIAVLPFADLSPDKDQGYFSDGIAEEILNVLVKVDGLSVASRTSAFGFKGQASLGIPAIAKSLQVRHILEGSVRKSGDTIRITAQLIDARTDKHLWSQTYDRVLSAENLFAIQDGIAKAIVTELAASIQVEATALTAPQVAVATESLDAYQLYLRARDMYRQRSSENIPRIVEMLEQALELDPDYAEAWAALAAVSVVAPSWRVDGRDFVQMTKDAAQRAMELDDSLGLPYAVLGSQASNSVPTDYVKVFAYYDQALEREPNLASALLWRGVDLMNVGMFDDATTDLERCLVIDPAYENCRRFLALTRLFMGETETAFALFEEGLLKGSLSQVSMFSLAYIATGDVRSGMFLLALSELAFEGLFDHNAEARFRALTEPGFDYDLEWQKLVNEQAVESGESLDEQQLLGSFTALVFRKYAAVAPDAYSAFWWHPHLADFHASPHRNRLIREIGIYDYWLKVGFPPQCRALGDKDFACD